MVQVVSLGFWGIRQRSFLWFFSTVLAMAFRMASLADGTAIVISGLQGLTSTVVSVIMVAAVGVLLPAFMIHNSHGLLLHGLRLYCCWQCYHAHKQYLRTHKRALRDKPACHQALVSLVCRARRGLNSAPLLHRCQFSTMPKSAALVSLRLTLRLRIAFQALSAHVGCKLLQDTFESWT